MNEIKLRPEVRAFAEAMELKLRENEHKGNWKDCTDDYLLKRSGEERDELLIAVCHLRRGPHPDAGQAERDHFRRTAKRMVIREAADVANFCMMIADNCGGLGVLP